MSSFDFSSLSSIAPYLATFLVGNILKPISEFWSKKADSDEQENKDARQRYTSKLEEALTTLTNKVSDLEKKLDGCEEKHQDAAVKLAVAMDRLQRLETKDDHRVQEAEKDKLIALATTAALTAKPQTLGQFTEGN